MPLSFFARDLPDLMIVDTIDLELSVISLSMLSHEYCTCEDIMCDHSDLFTSAMQFIDSPTIWLICVCPPQASWLTFTRLIF